MSSVRVLYVIYLAAGLGLLLAVLASATESDARLFSGLSKGKCYVGYSVTLLGKDFAVTAQNKTFLSGFNGVAMGFSPDVQQYDLVLQYKEFGYQHTCIHGVDRTLSLRDINRFVTRHRLWYDIEM